MARQQQLPTLEEPTHPDLDKQCEALLETQKAKTLAIDRYKTAHTKLLSLMKDKKITVYKHMDSGKVFQCEATEKVKHKNLKDKPDGGKGVNPDGPLDDDELDEPVSGLSEIIDGLEELAEEGPEGDDLKPKKKRKSKK